MRYRAARIKNAPLLCGFLVVCLISFCFGYFIRGENLLVRDQVHRLASPLAVSYEGASGFLPAGTPLYLDWQPGEGGFERYRIYVNVFGAPLQTYPTEKLGEIAPLVTDLD